LVGCGILILVCVEGIGRWREVGVVMIKKDGLSECLFSICDTIAWGLTRSVAMTYNSRVVHWSCVE
jgi:hypothetical protein